MALARTVSVSIAAEPQRVYDFASDPANMPLWAPGFVKSMEKRGARWVAATTLGEVAFEFAPRNAFGVLDHRVALPSGESFLNPMRVVANGTGSEVMFTLFRLAPMTDEEFERDARTVLSDLHKLKAVIEAL